jgi:hypothetical protein
MLLSIINNLIQRSLYLKANSRPADQESSMLFMDPEVHKNPPPDSELHESNQHLHTQFL